VHYANVKNYIVFEKIHNKKRRKIILIRPDVFSIEVVAFDEEQKCKN
jgi:hypothetical protein